MKSHPLCTSATTIRKRGRDYRDVDCVATRETERGSISVTVMHQQLRCGVGQYLGFVNFFLIKPLVIPLLVSRLYPSLVPKIQNIYLISRHVSDLL